MTLDRKSSSNGFLGTTSYDSVSNEDQRLWGIHNSQQKGKPSSARRVSEAEMAKGATLLMLLKDLPKYKPMIHKWTELTVLSMIVSVILDAVERATWTTCVLSFFACLLISRTPHTSLCYAPPRLLIL